MRAFTIIALALGTATVGAAVAAQQPRITNAQVTTAAGAPLDRTFQSIVSAQDGTGWIGYSVPAVRRDGIMCCFTSGATYISGDVIMSDGAAWTSGCRIEPRDANTAAPAPPAAGQPPAAPVKLEGPETLVVMFRIVDRKVERIRMFSEGCDLDAGGRPVRWLESVRPAESVALLDSFVAAARDRRDRPANGALSAMALHAAPEAAAALERTARTHQTASLRGEALFWTAQRGDAGAERLILQAIEKDPAPEVQKRGVFALSQLKNESATGALVRIARTGGTPALRGEAIFWLGQKAGRKAAAEITERIEQDPNTEVKKRAVFALSQLPKSEGVPLLIQVARTNPNPAVKKQAMFWLGQSKDPRAVEFFAEILK